MSNFNVKSILLGIGIGIILTATVSIIYLSGRDPVKDLTEQQIISQAEKYGMVKASVFQGAAAGNDTESSVESFSDSSAESKSGSSAAETTSILKARTSTDK